MGRDGDGLGAPPLPRARPPMAQPRRDPARHPDGRPGRDVRLPLARGRPGDVALPLPRRVAHDGRDDRHLPGAPVRLIAAAVAATALLAVPAASTAMEDGPQVSVAYAAYQPAQITTL